MFNQFLSPSTNLVSLSMFPELQLNTKTNLINDSKFITKQYIQSQDYQDIDNEDKVQAGSSTFFNILLLHKMNNLSKFRQNFTMKECFEIWKQVLKCKYNFRKNKMKVVLKFELFFNNKLCYLYKYFFNKIQIIDRENKRREFNQVIYDKNELYYPEGLRQQKYCTTVTNDNQIQDQSNLNRYYVSQSQIIKISNISELIQLTNKLKQRKLRTSFNNIKIYYQTVCKLQSCYQEIQLLIKQKRLSYYKYFFNQILNISSRVHDKIPSQTLSQITQLSCSLICSYDDHRRPTIPLLNLAKHEQFNNQNTASICQMTFQKHDSLSVTQEQPLDTIFFHSNNASKSLYHLQSDLLFHSTQDIHDSLIKNQFKQESVKQQSVRSSRSSQKPTMQTIYQSIYEQNFIQRSSSLKKVFESQKQIIPLNKIKSLSHIDGKYFSERNIIPQYSVLNNNFKQIIDAKNKQIAAREAVGQSNIRSRNAYYVNPFVIVDTNKTIPKI